jgi:CRISPR-associated protein Csd1
VALDPECKDQGYLLGRLFALYEEAQRAALGDVGASVKDKFYASASKHPRRVFGLLQAGCANHLSPAEQAKTVAQGIYPTRVKPCSWLGYYHQRAEFFRSTGNGLSPGGITSVTSPICLLMWSPGLGQHNAER